jgi:hypothetical protein
MRKNRSRKDFIRVASKGVYADGRSIDEITRECKLCRRFRPFCL